jgi:hypothetical protein
MDTLRVRVYNVRFGDAIFISVPDTENGQPKLRHILIDVGNALSKEGGRDFVFRPVLQDIRDTLAGAPIDLYIMTHEHMDHVQGLLYGEQREQLGRLAVCTAWLPASAAPNYYERDWPTIDEDGRPLPTPKKYLELLQAHYRAIEQYVAACKRAGESIPWPVQVLLMNNNPQSSADCVAYLRELAEEEAHYVFRGMDTNRRHPFEVATLDLWAPEENTAVYYGRFRPMTLGVQNVDGATDVLPRITTSPPPRGVDAGAYFQLVEARRNGYVENLLAIDQSRNNSSIVLCLEWRGWKLLFTGDAEIRSWKEMNKHHVLSPVHFLKMSHHASHNGTPNDELLEKFLPTQAHDDRDRVAVASTFPNTYTGIPHEVTISRLETRGVKTHVVYKELGDAATEGGNPGEEEAPVIGYLEFSFPADGREIDVQKEILSLSGRPN